MILVSNYLISYQINACSTGYFGMQMDHKIKIAAQKLTSGDVVGMPTETVYGLAADITNESAIRRVFALKARPLFDPLIVHVSSIEMARPLVLNWTPLMDLLAAEFWPGPLTLISAKNSTKVSDLITAGLPDVGIRFPNHSMALELITEVDSPLAAPSANLFGRTSPTKAAHVQAFFPDTLVLAVNACDVGIESTVLRVKESEGEAELSILRKGAVTKEQLESFIDRHGLSVKISFGKGKEASPGQGSVHYQMKSPLFLVSESTSEDSLRAMLSDHGCHHNWQELEFKNNDPLMVSRELYAKMHQISDQSNGDPVIFRLKKEMTGDLWGAILDRLRRASVDQLS